MQAKASLKRWQNGRSSKNGLAKIQNQKINPRYQQKRLKRHKRTEASK